MRMSAGFVVAASVALVLSACSSSSESESTPTASADASSAGTSVVVQLNSLNDSGEAGTATLTAQGDDTLVVLNLTGQPDGSFQPAHVHMNYCANIDPVPQYFLTDSGEQTDGGELWLENGQATALIHVPLSDLQATQHSVNVHMSPTDLPHYMACGDIPGVDGATPAPATTVTSAPSS